ncbi:protein dead ringer-like [Ctenocephalides felis]|uniref:protein dead ringer-like n=1 Tax=Ctenocephalides felis TaxID=7515 RepID=UPI000E6E27A6|nr:protein dead ringer-like [Ctenocephalides felis]
MSGLGGSLGPLTAPFMLPNNAQGLDLSEQHNSHYLHHSADVLEKLKMQVRDIKVDRDRKGEYDSDLKSSSLHSHLQSLASLSQHHSVSGIGGNIGGTVGGGVGVNAQTNRVNEEAQSAAGAFQMPYAFPHPVVSSFMPPPASSAPSVVSNGVAVNSSPATAGQQQAGSASSSSSEGSASSQQTWSFEEQFKQVRQLYEINDDPKRKEFLDDLFQFMQKREPPVQDRAQSVGEDDGVHTAFVLKIAST